MMRMFGQSHAVPEWLRTLLQLLVSRNPSGKWCLTLLSLREMPTVVEPGMRGNRSPPRGGPALPQTRVECLYLRLKNRRRVIMSADTRHLLQPFFFHTARKCGNIPHN